MHLRNLTRFQEIAVLYRWSYRQSEKLTHRLSEKQTKKEPAVNGSGDPGWLRGGDVRSRALTRIRVAPSESNISGSTQESR